MCAQVLLPGMASTTNLIWKVKMFSQVITMEGTHATSEPPRPPSPKENIVTEQNANAWEVATFFFLFIKQNIPISL